MVCSLAHSKEWKCLSWVSGQQNAFLVLRSLTGNIRSLNPIVWLHARLTYMLRLPTLETYYDKLGIFSKHWRSFHSFAELNLWLWQEDSFHPSLNFTYWPMKSFLLLKILWNTVSRRTTKAYHLWNPSCHTHILKVGKACPGQQLWEGILCLTLFWFEIPWFHLYCIWFSDCLCPTVHLFSLFQLFKRAKSQGLGNKDMCAVYRVAK